MATLKCLKRTHFLIMNKNLYESALQDIKNKRLKEKVDFLVTQIPLFQKNLSFNFLKKFADHLVEKNCVKDTIILKEGEDADQIFIVRKGEFVVSQKKRIDLNTIDNGINI